MNYFFEENLKVNIFTGQGREEILKRLSGGRNTKNTNQEDKPWWMLLLQIAGTILVLIAIGYFVIFSNIQKVVESSYSGSHWMHGWGSGIVSFIVAAIVARPIYISLGKAFVWKLNQKDLLILGSCIALVIVSAYSDRNKFFAKGVEKKELCSALLRGDKPSIKLLGQGSDEGLRCLPLSREEAALALAIDRNVWAKEIIPKSLPELEALALYDRGAVAIYIGYAKGADPKIYDGPDFNPRALGLLTPISEDELINYKASQRVTLLGLENAKRLEKEAEAKAAAALAEKQRIAAEAEAKRLEQERLNAQATEERRLTAEREAREREKREAEAKSKARWEWWKVLGFIVAGGIIMFLFFPPSVILSVILLLLHLAKGLS